MSDDKKTLKPGDFVRIKCLRTAHDIISAVGDGHNPGWPFTKDVARGRVGVIDSITTHDDCYNVKYLRNDTNGDSNTQEFNVHWLMPIAHPRDEITDEVAAWLGSPFNQMTVGDTTYMNRKQKRLIEAIEKDERLSTARYKKLRALVYDTFK